MTTTYALFNEGTLKLLNYLNSSKKKAYVTQMQKDLGMSYDTIYRARTKLEEYGLINIEEGDGGRGSKNWLYLNEKGKKVVTLLQEIEAIIKR